MVKPLHANWSTREIREAKPSSLHEIIAALSFALDLTEDAVPGHAVRTCLLASRLAAALGLPSMTMSDLYYASHLKDVGCSSNAARMCQIVGGDDRAVKAGAKLSDWRRIWKPQAGALKLLWEHSLPGARAWKKIARLLQIAAQQNENVRELIEMRCDRGASVVRKIGLGEEVATAVRHLDEHWDGGSYPGRLRGECIPLLARLLNIAQNLDVFCSAHGPEAAMTVLRERSGRWFDPELVRLAEAQHRSGTLWDLCKPGDSPAVAHKAVLDLAPDAGLVPKPARLDAICEAFAEVVDAKSHFTFRHSRGVRDAAVQIGRTMGLPEPQIATLRRAALLHDIGKLSVSNSILDKPGKLSVDEFAIMKQHSRVSREILDKVSAFAEIAIIAGDHHEKLDGSGYPNGLSAPLLSFESRLIAVADVYGALSEQRPYRPALEPHEIAEIMEKDIPGKLDSQCYEGLRVGLMNGKLSESESAESDSPSAVGAAIPKSLRIGVLGLRNSEPRNSELPGPAAAVPFHF